MTTPRKITAAVALLESAGYTVTPPVDSDAIRAKRRKVGRPRADYDRIRALRGPSDAPLHTVPEIAQIMGCGEATVMRAIHESE